MTSQLQRLDAIQYLINVLNVLPIMVFAMAVLGRLAVQSLLSAVSRPGGGASRHEDTPTDLAPYAHHERLDVRLVVAASDSEISLFPPATPPRVDTQLHTTNGLSYYAIYL